MFRDDLLVVVLEIGIDRFARGVPMRSAPRTTIFEALVVHLVDCGAVVTVRFEVLRQRDAIRLCNAEVRIQIPNLGRIGSQASHDRRARWTANRLLTVGFVEDDAACSNAIDVRRFDNRVAVTAKFGSQVIDSNE